MLLEFGNTAQLSEGAKEGLGDIASHVAARMLLMEVQLEALREWKKEVLDLMDCRVCLGPMDKATTLDCGHAGCEDCIHHLACRYWDDFGMGEWKVRSWASSVVTCPVCRQQSAYQRARTIDDIMEKMKDDPEDVEIVYVEEGLQEGDVTVRRWASPEVQSSLASTPPLPNLA